MAGNSTAVPPRFVYGEVNLVTSDLCATSICIGNRIRRVKLINITCVFRSCWIAKVAQQLLKTQVILILNFTGTNNREGKISEILKA